MSKDVEKFLREAAKARGAQLHDCGDGHFQIVGDRLVNYWPFSKSMTAHLRGASAGRKHTTIGEAIEMAFIDPPKPTVTCPAPVGAKTSKGFRKLRNMHRVQGGLCSICATPMVLVDFVALPKPERKALVKDRERYGLTASIEHTLPYSQFRGIQYNRRAAHRACNETKADQLIEPYPLPCYEDKSQLPRIKTPNGWIRMTSEISPYQQVTP